MSPENWRQIENLYLEAAALALPDRTAFLDRTCAGRPELRRDLENLLAADLENGDFLELPPARLAADLLSRPPGSPEFIGRYRIQGLLGEGGMGRVYKAEQQTPHRIVALKVIRAETTSRPVLRRFEREAEALGRLHHPGIAQIYEAGTFEGGQPYFAMEFIEGRPLMAYAQDRSLDTDARLGLMAKICDAVAHAHQHGILHRDLKPGNILVDETGQPKILDFGVALITDSDVQATRQTDIGQIIGTLEYMSPEQSLGDPLGMDLRSDIYSLGVLFYELLAGKLPYGSASRSLPDIVRVIRETDPEPLSIIQRAYRGDIEIIAAKALEKDRERRYATADKMAADIRRHLASQPIVARRPSASYRAAKFVRRYRTLVIVTSLAGLLILVFAVSMAVLAVKYARERNAAETQRKRAEQVSDFLTDLFRSADPFVAQGRTITARNLLDDGAMRIFKSLHSEIAVRSDLLETIGHSYMRMGVYDRAEEMFTALIADRRRLAVPGTEIARIYRLRGDIRRMRGNLRGAEEDVRQALAIVQSDGADKLELSNVLNNLALILQSEGKYADACAQLERAVTMSRTMPSEVANTLVMTDNWGAVLGELARYAEGERVLRDVIAARRKLLGDNHPQVPRSMMRLGRLLMLEGKYEEAEKMARAGLDGLQRGLGPEHADVVMATFVLGQFYLETGHATEAESNLRAALQSARKVLGPAHIDTAYFEANLGTALIEGGHLRDAEPLLSDALTICRNSTSPTRRTADILTANGRLLVAEGRLAAAEPLLNEAVALRQAQLGQSHPETARAMVNLAGLRLAQNRCRDAVTLSRDALAMAHQFLPERHTLVATAAIGEAKALLVCGQASEARPLALEALHIRTELMPPGAWQIAEAGKVVAGKARGSLRASRLP